jgi:hypothetical protein
MLTGPLDPANTLHSPVCLGRWATHECGITGRCYDALR